MVEDGAAAVLRDDASLLAHVNVIRRRKWVIALAVVLVPLAAFAISLREAPVYRSTADVLITRAPGGSLGVPQLGSSGSPERMLQTQADLALSPSVAAAVLEELKLRDRSPEALVAQTTVTPKANSDLLQFTVTGGDPRLVPELATAYARQFTIYRRTLDTGALRRARREVTGQMERLEQERKRDTAVYERLLEKEQELATVEALLSSTAALIRPAGGAVRIKPNPVRNAALGLVLGLFLGVGVAFLWEALDTRVRHTPEIERRLGLPLLARVPQPPRWLQRTGRLAMLAAPQSMDAEAYRVLRTNFEFFNMEHGARVVMVTSATQGEGKSTTISNLAVALSRAGRRVVLVDLDLRRPALDRFFGLEDAVGLTDVVRGEATLVTVPEAEDGSAPHGRLEVLTTGPLPKDTGEFVGSPALSRLLDELRERADVVLVDSPPLLAVGDAMSLSAKVDGIIVLTRLNVVRRGMLDELRRVLGNIPAAKLGFVVAGAETEQEKYGYGYGYRYGYGYGYRPDDSPKPKRRARR